MRRDGRIILSGTSVAVRRAGAKNKQCYHDRCIAATPSNFLLQESKYGLAGAKSPCYSRPEVGISTATKIQVLATERQAENERANLNNSSQRGESDETSSDCNHRDRRHCRHVGFRGVWSGKPAEQRICLVRIRHPCQ